MFATFVSYLICVLNNINTYNILMTNEKIEADIKNCDPKLDRKCIPVLNADEALCKYGQSGNARGEACKRVKDAGGKLEKPKPPVSSMGGAYAM